jgi:hypothetical protein
MAGRVPRQHVVFIMIFFTDAGVSQEPPGGNMSVEVMDQALKSPKLSP